MHGLTQDVSRKMTRLIQSSGSGPYCVRLFVVSNCDFCTCERPERLKVEIKAPLEAGRCDVDCVCGLYLCCTLSCCAVFMLYKLLYVLLYTRFIYISAAIQL